MKRWSSRRILMRRVRILVDLMKADCPKNYSAFLIDNELKLLKSTLSQTGSERAYRMPCTLISSTGG